jgi:hypothetical protein
MRTTFLLTGAVLILAVIVAAWWLIRGPDASQFADLREPRFSRMNDQRMLVVEAAGDPNVVGSGAFKLLFSTYFKLDGVSRIGRPPSPRARWTNPQGTPKDKWLGRYALPLSESVTTLAAGPTGGPRTSVATWAYGDVAEIMHVGPYSAEQPDIERLLRFIDSQGYRVVGDHEEEYVKGPGMFFAGDPDKYLTIVRLRVEKSSGG